ncbi:hypothetical protein CR513_42605, partial [Mucuna pruriens]
MTASSERLVLTELAEPARPPNSYDMIFEIPSTAYPPQQWIDEKHVHKEAGERKLGLVVNRVSEKDEKHPARFRDQINIEETLAKESTTSRDLEQPVEEKLERFKVRTVVAGQVLQEDNIK